MHGRIEVRDILRLTVMFDHDVIDGAPAARKARRLVELMESGYGVVEDQTATPTDIEPAAIWVAQEIALDPANQMQ